MKTNKSNVRSRSKSKSKSKKSIKNNINNTNTKKLLLQSAFLDTNKVKKILKSKKEKWELTKNKSEKIDWIHTDEKHSFDKTLWDVKSTIRSNMTFDNDLVANKYQFIENLLKLSNPSLNKLLLQQFKINCLHIFQKREKLTKSLGIYKKLFTNKIWILKNIFGCQGKDIFVIENWDQLVKILSSIIYNNDNRKKWRSLNYKKYQTFRTTAKFGYQIEWVLQEYIDNPLLIQDKKFHLRSYLLYTDKQSYFFKNHRIFTAKIPYQHSYYLNKDIHDTHLQSTPKELNYNPDLLKILPLKQQKNIESQLKILSENIAKVIKGKCYPENDSCYHLFATDIMITQDYQLKLIEVNTRPGMGEYPKQKVDYPHLVFEGILDNIVTSDKINDNFIKL